MNFLISLDIRYILTLASILLGLINLVLIVWILVRLKRLLKGGDGKTIESVLNLERQTILELVKYREDSSKYLAYLDSRLKKKVHGIEAIRFNPFQGTGVGGNNSFSVSLIDEEGKGIVLSGLHSREKMNVFVKPIQNWTGDLELSDEENKVLNSAKEKTKFV